MHRKALILLLLTLALVAIMEGAYIAHLHHVIKDQQIYMDGGCRGWYQGEEE